MNTKVKKWGNSLGVRLPKAIVEQKRFNDGSPVQILLEEDEVIIRSVVSENKTLEALLNKVSDGNLHKEVGWGKVEGHEIW